MEEEIQLVKPVAPCAPSSVAIKLGPGDTPLVGRNAAISSVKWFKLIGINLLAFALELCASAGFTYIPPIMLKGGFSEGSVSAIMGIGPFISLVLVPMIGRWSDKCQSMFGRRRPFMLSLGLLMLLSLIIIPYSKEISSHTQGVIKANFVIGIGIVLLDFTSQALMNPCKALIPDIFSSSDDQNSGFTVYSCMLSLGGCTGYLITSLNWVDTTLGVLSGSQEKAVFSVLFIFLLLLLILNLSIAKETPLHPKSVCSNGHHPLEWEVNGHITAQEKVRLFTDKENGFISLKRKLRNENGFNHTFLNQADNDLSKNSQRFSFSLFHSIKSRGASKNFRTFIKYTCCCVFYPVQLLFALKFSLQDFINMPPVLFRLFVASLFGWMGIMCHDMYYSDFVGQNLYHQIMNQLGMVKENKVALTWTQPHLSYMMVIYQGKPHADKESIAVNLYDEGVRMGSWGLLLHCLSAALYAAFVQERLIASYGQRKVYLFGIIVFSISLLGTLLTNSIYLVNICAALSGLGLAAVTTVPYSLVTEYHNSKELYYGSSKERGVGEDMAVLDSSFYLSQIIPSLFLGYMVDFSGSSSVYMIVAALCGAASCYFSFFITFPHTPKT